MHGPIRAGLDKADQFALLLGREAGRVALRPGVLQPLRAALVEAVDPISKGLAIHAADARRLRPAHPVQHRSQGQQAPALVHMLRPGGKPAKLTRREVRPQAHG
jgi:hypothetical protein